MKEAKDKAINWELIIKVVEDYATSEEFKELEEWLSESSENRNLFSSVKKILLENDSDTSIVFNDFLEKNGFPQQDHLPKVKINRSNIFQTKIARYAASAIILVSALATGYYAFKFHSYNWFTSNVKSNPPQVFSTPNGRYEVLNLNDGTKIKLYPGSTITISGGYLAKREVFLNGEAFFEVSSVVNKPFAVFTNQLITKVIGTRFKIDAFNKDIISFVSVIDGKVSVSKANTSGELTLLSQLSANEKIIVDSKNVTYKIVSIPETVSKAISEGKLVFDNLNMVEIGNKLERHYNINVNYSDDLTINKHISASFDNVPIYKLASILSQLSGIQLRLEGKELYISNKE